MYQVLCDNLLIYHPSIAALKIKTPKVSLEVNKTGNFDFQIFPTHPFYSDLKRLKSIIKVYQDDNLLFRGRIIDDQSGFYNQKQVTCEGELAFLLDSIQRPYTYTGDIPAYFAQLITSHNSQVDEEHQFKVGNITVTDPNGYINRSDTTYQNTFNAITTKLIETHGGYLWVRHETDGNYLDYLSDFTTLSNQPVEFGKNLLDLTRKVKGSEIATAIIPLGAKLEGSEDRVTIASVNDGVDYVYNQEAVDLYGWIFKPQPWDDVTEPANLLTKANEYLASAVNLSTEIELSAVDLSALNTDFNSFHLGTYVPVKTDPHGIDQNFLVNKLSIDLSNPKSNKLTLGTTFSSFTEQTISTTKTTQNLISTVETNQTDVSSAIITITEQTTSQISQSSNEILAKVSEDYYLAEDASALVQSINTEFTQTKEDFEFKFNNFNASVNDLASGTDAQFEEFSKYIRFVDGDILLGEVGNELVLKIQNDRISFLQNSVEVAYFSNRKLYVNDGEYINSLKIGNYAFVPRENGNLSFKKVV